MRQTKNIFGGSVPWVDRRTGGPNHSPTWDDNTPKSASKGGSAQYEREPGLFFTLQSAAIGLFAAVYIMDGLSWWVLPIWFALWVTIMCLCQIRYFGQAIFIAMSIFYGWCAYHLLTTFMFGPIWVWAGTIATPIITYIIQRGSMTEVQN